VLRGRGFRMRRCRGLGICMHDVRLHFYVLVIVLFESRRFGSWLRCRIFEMEMLKYMMRPRWLHTPYRFRKVRNRRLFAYFPDVLMSAFNSNMYIQQCSSYSLIFYCCRFMIKVSIVIGTFNLHTNLNSSLLE
jgi:hypothetical protein